MPEIKNTFIKGKMNKDLDARLLPNGEYRDAQNILIGKSEGSDVGALQTLKGNQVAVASLTNRGTIIGYCVDRKAQSNGSNRIFYFVAATDAANHAIYYHNTLDTAAPTPIVKGSFLNFSPTKLITGVNIIDDLLFFTDDSNQPRKINVQRAIDEGLSYYDSDFKIAVAKYYPYLAPEVLSKHDQEFTGDGSTTAFTLTTANFPTIPTIKAHVKVYVDSELISASNYSYSNPTLTFTGNTGNTSVLESSGAPKNTKTVLVEAEIETGIQVSKTTATGSTSGSSTTVTLTAANNDIHVGQSVTGTGISNGTTVSAINGATLTISQAASLTSIALTFENNKRHLEEEFVRFAYRFRFKDGEYSLISPFTQHCFIPKTYNGSLSSDHSDDGLTNNQIKEAYKNTELESFTNDATEVKLKIPLPSATSYNDYEISEIEILYKEADASNIKSVAKINAYPDDTELGDEYIYTYKSTLPYKTLPEDQVTRVYDNVPLKAKAQEITAGRLVYGNFEQNHTQPSIDFEAGSQQKTNTTQKYYIQYPYHTIKQRRTYQVGIVLADIHGRQSPVILPKDQNKSSVIVQAKDADFDSQSWNGDCLNVTFNDTIPNAYDSSTNPLGWYSWKMVVKQIEQEYYTVYGPRSVKGFPNASTPNGSGVTSQTYEADDKRSWLVLHGDNINKIPRDSNTNIQEAGTSASVTSLYPKIIDLTTTGTPSGMSDGPLLDVISIGTLKDHGLRKVDAASSNNFEEAYNGFYLASKNPLAAELPDGYGAIDASGSGTFNSSTKGMSVWETDPVKSALDIYFETSTSGLVSELNSEIVAGSGGPADIKIDGSDTDSFNEGVTAPFSIGALTALDSGGSQLGSMTFTLVSVYAQSDLATDIKNKFDINSSNLRVTSETFYYGTSGETYNVTINAVDGSSNSLEDTITVTLANVAPEFQNVSGTPGTTTTTHQHYKVGSIFTATAKNGSHDDTTPQDTLGLTYSITEVREDPSGTNTDVTSSNLFSIGSSTGVISSTGYFATSKIGKVYRLTLKVLDAANDESFKDTGYIDIEITPFTTSSTLYGNFSALCTTTDSQVFYVTKSAASSTDSFEVGDIVYTTYSGGSLSNPFGGYIITATSGGAYGDGKYARVAGGAAGEVQEVDIDRDCSGGGP